MVPAWVFDVDGSISSCLSSAFYPYLLPVPLPGKIPFSYLSRCRSYTSLWLLDSEEVDDFLPVNLTMLEELELDFVNIGRTTLFMTCYPWTFLYIYLQSNTMEMAVEHPLSKCSKVDFWGPSAVVSLYCGILWTWNVKNVPWILVIWAFSAFFSHLVARVSHKSTYILHATILGYSIVPLIPFSLLVVVSHSEEWYLLVVKFLVSLWSLLSVYISFRELLCPKVKWDSRIFIFYSLKYLHHYWCASSCILVATTFRYISWICDWQDISVKTPYDMCRSTFYGYIHDILPCF